MPNLDTMLKKLSHIRLSADAKSDMRQLISTHIDTSQEVSRWQEFVRGLSKVGTPATALAMVLVMLGGLSLAAEDSLPGDRLYPIKVNVNEEFLSLTSVSMESEAINSSRIAERRIAELEELAAQGELDQATSDQLADAVDAYTSKAREQIAAISEEGEASSAASLETELASTLTVHSDILTDLSISNDGKTATATAAVAKRLREIAEGKAESDVAQVATTQAGIQTTRSPRSRTRAGDNEEAAASTSAATATKAVLSKDQIRDLLERTADRLTDAREKFSGAAESITNDTVRLRLEDTLVLAAEEITTALDAIEKEDYREAESHLREALTLAHETTIIITARKNLSDSSGVSIDELLDNNELTDTAPPAADEDANKDNESDTDADSDGGLLKPTDDSREDDDEKVEDAEDIETVPDSATTATDTQNLTTVQAISPHAYERITEALERVSEALATSTLEETSSKDGLLPARRSGDEGSEQTPDLDEVEKASSSEDEAS